MIWYNFKISIRIEVVCTIQLLLILNSVVPTKAAESKHLIHCYAPSRNCLQVEPYLRYLGFNTAKVSDLQAAKVVVTYAEHSLELVQQQQFLPLLEKDTHPDLVNYTEEWSILMRQEGLVQHVQTVGILQEFSIVSPLSKLNFSVEKVVFESQISDLISSLQNEKVDVAVLPSRQLPEDLPEQSEVVANFELFLADSWILWVNKAFAETIPANFTEKLLRAGGWKLPSTALEIYQGNDLVPHQYIQADFQNCGEQQRCRVWKGLAVVSEVDGQITACSQYSNGGICGIAKVGKSIQLKLLGQEQNCRYRVWRSNEATTPQWKTPKLKDGTQCQFKVKGKVPGLHVVEAEYLEGGTSYPPIYLYYYSDKCVQEGSQSCPWVDQSDEAIEGLGIPPPNLATLEALNKKLQLAYDVMRKRGDPFPEVQSQIITRSTFGGQPSEMDKTQSIQSQDECDQLPESILNEIKITPDKALDRVVKIAIQGQQSTAFCITQKLIELYPQNAAALVVRGTLKNFKGDSQGAISDLTQSTEISPTLFEAWRRRAEIWQQMGHRQQAIADYKHAIEIAQTKEQKIETLMLLGMIYNQIKDYQNSRDVFLQITKADENNYLAWNMLGLAYSLMGDLEEGIDAGKKSVQIQPQFKEGWGNLMNFVNEWGNVQEGEAIFSKIKDDPQVSSLRLFYEMGETYRRRGQQRKAIKVMQEGLDKFTDTEEYTFQCSFKIAVCLHTLGFFEEAIEQYSKARELPFNGDDAKESFNHMFYSREGAAYIMHNMDRDITTFSIDQELNPIFKQGWMTRKEAGRQQMNSVPGLPYEQNNLNKKIEHTPKKELKQLVAIADKVGEMIHYDHPGFLSNKRYQRAAGLAALELAQTTLKLLNSIWRKQECGKNAPIYECGDFQIPNSWSSLGYEDKKGQHPMSWRDVFDILQKWRQLSDWHDAVFWVDLLPAEEEAKGLGNNTPMFSGQMRRIRYFTYFYKALELSKDIACNPDKGQLLDLGNQAIALDCDDSKFLKKLGRVNSSAEMWQLIGQDHQFAVELTSAAVPNERLEGTRFTNQKFPDSVQPNAYEFGIRSPLATERWEVYSRELEYAWIKTVEALVKGDRAAAADWIVTLSYYWYNFMPWSRGSAAAGYANILGLFWAAGMPVTSKIPRKVQVDFEAMVSTSPSQFIANLKPWLYPQEVTMDSVSNKSSEFSDPSNLPDVQEVLNTMRKRIEILNYPEDSIIP